MRIFPSLLLLCFTVVSCVFAQEDGNKVKLDYQSDVARLRRIVINSLYSHRDVWLRELLSNANDALEKFRLTALTSKEIWDGSSPLNITIKVLSDEYTPNGRIIISDTGIGMNAEELASNLGTLAKSGTSEFLAEAENSDSTTTGNFIGAFGVGFYSSFLVADHVYVASRPPKSAQDPNPIQYVFSSTAEDSTFEIYPDPRGDTLRHGTEITLILKHDAMEYLDITRLSDLVAKHSSFSSTFPIYILTERNEEVPDEEVLPKPTENASVAEESSDDKVDEDEATVEAIADKDEAKESELPKTKTVVVHEWVQLNPHPPIWMRDSKDVTDEEYELFYQSTFKDYAKPAAWQAFSGDSSGASFRGILYLPSTLSDAYWQNPTLSGAGDIRLMVKHVFITSDFGDDQLPRWAGWVKVVVDAEDLPLNVSRETLQSTRFLKQIKHVILKHLIQLFNKLATENPDKFYELRESYNTVFKVGAVEDEKNRDKLAALARFETNQRDNVTLDDYVGNKRKGQKQIFFIADGGKSKERIAKSVFIEKLGARGYEVLLLNEPLDEILLHNIRRWKSMSFQDAAKAGLHFGDEDSEQEQKEQEELYERFRPLLQWLLHEAEHVVVNVILSNRLVTSSCAIVADTFGYTANIERLINAAHHKDKAYTHDYIKKQKILEINAKSPLIEGLLHRVQQLPTEEEGRDLEAELELREITSILIDGALVRSGFEVHDSNEFYVRVDRILRQALGVSPAATAETVVKPAPPVDPEMSYEDEIFGEMPEYHEQFSFNHDSEAVHDEL